MTRRKKQRPTESPESTGASGGQSAIEVLSRQLLIYDDSPPPTDLDRMRQALEVEVRAFLNQRRRRPQ